MFNTFHWKTHELSKNRVRAKGPNYTTAAQAFVKATLRLGLRSPLVARKKTECSAGEPKLYF